MMRPLILLAGAAALISAAPVPVPSSSPEQLYLLSYDLFNGDQLIGSPRMIVAKDRPETVTVEGPHGYTLSATLVTTRDATKQVAILSQEISLPGESGVVKIAAPIVAIPFGEPTRLEFVRKDRPADEPFRMDVTVSE